MLVIVIQLLSQNKVVLDQIQLLLDQMEEQFLHRFHLMLFILEQVLQHLVEEDYLLDYLVQHYN